MNSFHESHRASVPVRVATLMIVHCGTCLGYEIHLTAYEQSGDELLETLTSRTKHLGPFDGGRETALSAHEGLDELLAALDRPWSDA